MNKKGLGRGLGALLPSIENEDENMIKEIKLTEIEPNKFQPRRNFDVEKLELLADSIKVHGVIQPIIVKRQDTGFYQIVAGERRWRAARLAGLKTIPVVIKDYQKRDVMEIALIENLQREDLNPIEESEAYKNLLEEYDLTQEEISSRVGKSRSAIANSLRLLNLSDELKQLLIEDKITTGHARALLSVDDVELQKSLAEKIIKEGLNVRDTERLVKNTSMKKHKNSPTITNELQMQYAEVANKLSSVLGTKVKIHTGKQKSRIEIEYYSEDELERIMEFITKY